MNTPERPISRIHILIHPGFITDPRVNEDGYESKFEGVFKGYLNEARAMTPTEVMIAFCHAYRSELKIDLKAGNSYAVALRELKGLLKERLVVIANQQNDWISSPYLGRLALASLSRRGFVFNRDIETVAYGETDGACVPAGAIMFNSAARLRQPTRIIQRLTDSQFYPKSVRRQNLQDTLTDYRSDRIVIEDFSASIHPQNKLS